MPPTNEKYKACVAAGNNADTCASVFPDAGTTTEPRDRTPEEDEIRRRWNADRGKGVGAIGEGEADDATAYADAYGVPFEEALDYYTAWEQGQEGIPSPLEAAAIAAEWHPPMAVPTPPEPRRATIR